jgi:hypothetical protein
MIHCRTPAPTDAASAPLVTMAVIWPTSPHFEKKIAAKAQ